MSDSKPKRERKAVDHFTPGDGPKKAQKAALQEGKGTKLGEIRNVNFKLDKVKAGDELLEDLHFLLYKSKGKAQTRKKEIKSFSGLVFSEDNKEAEQEKVQARLRKWTTAHLNSLMDVLDISRGSGEEGTKDKKVQRVLDFLMEPQALSDKDLAAQAAAKKEKAAKSKAKKETTSAKKATSTKKEAAKKAPAQGKKTAAPEKEAAAGKKRKTTEKDEKPAKKAKKGAKTEPAAEEAEEEEDVPEAERKSEPSTASKWPAADQIIADVEAMMQSALNKNEDISLTNLYEQLGEKYGMDVTEIKKKKASIRSSVKKFQEKQQAAAAEDATDAGNEEETAKDGEPMETDATAEEDAAQVEEAAAQSKEPAKDEPLITEEATNEGDEHKTVPMEMEVPAEAEAIAEPKPAVEHAQSAPEPDLAHADTNGTVPVSEEQPASVPLTIPPPAATESPTQEPVTDAEQPKAVVSPQPVQPEDAIFPDSTFGNVDLNF